jgi:hypothetical protein
MSYQKTREALAAYDGEPTSGNADLVRVSFWLEAPTHTRSCVRNPTVDEVRAVLKLAAQHEWEFYANGSFCKKCGASIGSGGECRA